MLTVNHIAGAGSSYTDIYHAGNRNLLLHCQEFPVQNNSSVIPSIYTSKYTEYINPATGKPDIRPDLLKAGTKWQHDEKRAYDGLVLNRSGAECERIVYEKINDIVKKQPADAMLVFFNYEVNWPKCQALSCDVPTMTSDLQKFILQHGSKFQVDFLILIRNLGLIIVEVKRTEVADSIEKSRKQVNRSSSFF